VKITSRAEVKIAWNPTFTPTYAVMAWCLIKGRNNFALSQITLISSLLLLINVSD